MTTETRPEAADTTKRDPLASEGTVHTTREIEALIPHRYPLLMVDRIVERTDGVPLFVEELAHALPTGDDAAAMAAIPTSLLELLTARLDAVSTSAHETVQFAAACGREVAWKVLAAVVPKSSFDDPSGWECCLGVLAERNTVASTAPSASRTSA